MTRGGRRPAATAAILVLAGLLGGCGPDAPPPPAATATDIPLPTPVTTTFALNQTAWYAGLVIHVDTVTSVLRAGTGSVTAEIRLENPGPDPASLDAPIRLTSSGQVVEPVRGTALPDVPAGGSAAATVTFDIDATFDVDLAAIRIGRTACHQVVLPLRVGPIGVTTLAPRVFDIVGSARAGSLIASVDRAELRADLPDWGLEQPPGILTLTITYHVKYVGTFSGGFAFTTANLVLELPDGKIIAAREDGHSAPALLLKSGVAINGLESRFDVPAPGFGVYALIVRDGSVGKKIPITLTIAGT